MILGHDGLAKSRLYQDAADAPATLRAYASDVSRFKAWCHQADLVAFPAKPEVVGAYVAAARARYAYSTLRRRVAAIARASALAGAPLDTKDHAIRETLRGIGRTQNGRARHAAALTTADLPPLMSICGRDICGEPAVRLTGLRDRAILLLAIAADQSAMTCPVADLRSWLDHADIRDGPIFRKVARGGHVQSDRLTGTGVWQIVRKRTASAGLKTASSDEYFSPQSLRAGLVTPTSEMNPIRYGSARLRPG